MDSAPLKGIEDNPVKIIENDGLGALVSKTDLEEIDPLRRYVQVHTNVQESVLENHPLLPMSFGIIAESLEDIKILLEEYNSIFRDKLDHYRNKVEVHLKVKWNPEKFKQHLRNNDSTYNRLEEKLENASGEKAQKLQLEAGKYVKQQVEEWKQQYMDPLVKELETLAVEMESNDATGVQTLLNQSFLLEQSYQETFLDIIYEYDENYRGKMDFKVVGPIAPYDFVQVPVEEEVLVS